MKPVVFDRYPEIGGLLTFGIPEFKLEKEVMTRRREIFEGMGMEFRLNTEIGVDVTAGGGCSKSTTRCSWAWAPTSTMKAASSVSRCPAWYEALPYLIGNVNRNLGRAAGPGASSNLAGKRVVVLGGGDTAMDCVRTAVRQQARSVTCAYRRDEVHARLPREVKNAKEEGVRFPVQPPADRDPRRRGGSTA